MIFDHSTTLIITLNFTPIHVHPRLKRHWQTQIHYQSKMHALAASRGKKRCLKP